MFYSGFEHFLQDITNTDKGVRSKVFLWSKNGQKPRKKERISLDNVKKKRQPFFFCLAKKSLLYKYLSLTDRS